MRRDSRTIGTVAACLVILGACANRRVSTSSASTARAFAGFHQGITAYLEIRDDARAEVPHLKYPATPEEISAYSRALAAAIRSRRADTRQGAIFTPAAVEIFRRAAHREIVEAPAAKAAIEIGNPPLDPVGTDVVIAVNGVYAAGAPVSLMPTAMLTRFPRLPRDLEYRFVGRTLVLRDREANLIVDYAPEVAPPL
jgi:hypothetical protein